MCSRCPPSRPGNPYRPWLAWLGVSKRTTVARRRRATAASRRGAHAPPARGAPRVDADRLPAGLAVGQTVAEPVQVPRHVSPSFRRKPAELTLEAARGPRRRRCGQDRRPLRPPPGGRPGPPTVRRGAGSGSELTALGHAFLTSPTG